ncbi:MAG: translation initiation factor IF-2 [Candidatus Micrarchaeota archaeon]
MLRQPIVCVLGHVDHGKTTILDSIRETGVAKREHGGITQAIGASIFPRDLLDSSCGSMLERMRIKLTIPGLLFIDTPGHEAFTNLRKRGGSIADIAILVIDCTKGIEAQTIEAIEILREYKTPFIVAFNKIDALNGWLPQRGACFADSAKKQRPDVIERLDEKTYQLIGALYNYGFQAERFDRVADFTKQVAIVPVSAKTREGLQELLLFVAGLAQRFMEKTLTTSEDESGKGAILEVREERGLGKTLDVILYDGCLRQGDEIAFNTLGGPATSKVKALLEPKPLDEMRDPREKFKSVDEVRAATGVKIACERAEDAIGGSSLFVVRTQEEAHQASEALEEELKQILFETQDKGVLIKADALGSIEAITRLFAAEKIPVKRTAIGAVSRRDVADAIAMRDKNKLVGVIFAFNVPVADDAASEAEAAHVKIFDEKIIYNLIDGYKRWRDESVESERREAFTNLVLPAKILIMQGCCFRVSNPCIIGIEVLEGRIRKDYPLMTEDGKPVGAIKSIQRNKESVDEAKKGDQLAISIPEPFFGRQICEKQVLLSSPSKDDVASIEAKYAKALSDGERELLAQIKRIKGYSVF